VSIFCHNALQSRWSDPDDPRNEVKMLLLGAGESGKSTIRKCRDTRLVEKRG
jgi:hypothetical protein